MIMQAFRHGDDRSLRRWYVSTRSNYFNSVGSHEGCYGDWLVMK